ncbi:hypothetical protein [Burkholderia phage BCSR5]|nr:hypothetical protein [Burkholderia phage BCSR5]
MATFLFSKIAEETVVVEANLASVVGDQTITDVQLQPVTPVTSPPLNATLLGVFDKVARIQLDDGINNVSYGFKLQVTTNAQVFVPQCAVAVVDVPFVPYTTQEPDAFDELIGALQAGTSAIGNALFVFDPSTDPSGGFVTWDLIGQDGVIYANGNAYEYSVEQNGIQSIVRADCIINAPTTIPPTALDQRYQLRYTLQLPASHSIAVDPDSQPTQTAFYSFEYVEITGLNTVPLGTMSTVEMVGVPASLEIVTDTIYDNMTVEIWSGGQQLTPAIPLDKPTRVANGFYWQAVVDTKTMPVSMVPYQVIYKYWNNANAAYVNQEYADLFIINPSIGSAINDVKARINKAHTTLYGTPDSLFPETVVMTWLRRGMDMFNGFMGKFTTFDMTNALGSIREYWLLCAEYGALQAQALMEGEKSFDWQGAAISLNVDHHQYYDGMAQAILGRLDNELKPFKENLIYKGVTSGDGSADPSKLRAGAIGAVGITITPASSWGRFLPGYPARVGR